MVEHEITTLFCDVGGVLLTNGWDRHSRMKAAEQFNFDIKEFESRHQMCFYLHEIGKITLKEYLEETLFYQTRAFSTEKFIEFMHAQSKPHEDVIDFVKNLKQTHHLKIVLFSNEGRELTDYRLRKFGFHDFVDFFVFSSYVHARKPDKEIFRMALDLVQRPPASIIYIDDRQMFIDIAIKMGIHGIWHVDLKTTQNMIKELLASPSSIL